MSQLSYLNLGLDLPSTHLQTIPLLQLAHWHCALRLTGHGSTDDCVEPGVRELTRRRASGQVEDMAQELP